MQKSKRVPACRKSGLTFDTQKHEEIAVFAENTRFLSVSRIAGIALAMEQSVCHMV